MKIHDISVAVSGAMPVWPGDPPVVLEPASSIRMGDECNVTRIVMGAHTGTHVDAPRHFIDGGASVDEIPPGALIGPCRVIEVRDAAIGRRHLETHPIEAGGRILIKTRNSSFWRDATAFREDFAALERDAAEYLAEREVALVGIDYLSVEAFGAARGHPVHRILLSRGIVILEGLDLSAVGPGPYELICLPLKLSGADGAPARAILRET